MMRGTTKALVQDIHRGTYVVESGSLSHVDSPNGRIEKASVIAILVERHGDRLVVDDGTGRLDVRLFADRDQAASLLVGHPLHVIGSPREHEGSRYLVAEIVKGLENPVWVRVRRAELRNEEPVHGEAPVPQETGDYEAVLARIKELDKGEGAPLEEVTTPFENGDELVRTLLAEGEVFEIRAGRLKVLD